MPTFITAAELATLLHRTRGSINNARVNKPWTLPPAYKIPGSRYPLWDLDEVHAWIKQHREPQRAPTDQGVLAAARRGRPPKAPIERRYGGR